MTEVTRNKQQRKNRARPTPIAVDRSLATDSEAANPFVALIGILEDDPDYDKFMEEVRKYREEITREYNEALDMARDP